MTRPTPQDGEGLRETAISEADVASLAAFLSAKRGGEDCTSLARHLLAGEQRARHAPPTPQDGEGLDPVERIFDLLIEQGCVPFMARIGDFTVAEVAAGALREADRQADEKNREFCRRILAAVAPDIAAAARRAAFAELLDGAEQRRGGPASPDDPAALLAAQVRRQCAEELRALADDESEPWGGKAPGEEPTDHDDGLAVEVPALLALADRWSPQSTEGDRDVHSHPDR